MSAGRWKPTPDAATVQQAIAAYRDFLRPEERAPKTLLKYEKVFERAATLARERGSATWPGSI